MYLKCCCKDKDNQCLFNGDEMGSNGQKQKQEKLEPLNKNNSLNNVFKSAGPDYL